MKISKKTCQITFFALAPPKLKKSSLKKQYTFYNYSLKIFNYRLYHSKDSSCDFPEIPEEINMHLGSGLLHHRFGFRSVYDPNRRPPYVSN